MERELIKEEKEMVALMEKRGVAGHPWKREIDSIMRYIREYIKGSPKECDRHEKIEFTLPYQLSNQFTFLGDLEINVEATYNKDNNRTGGGSWRSNPKVFYSDDLKELMGSYSMSFMRQTNKLYHKEIRIECTYNDTHNVNLGQIQGSLYHEINHAYDEFVCVRSDGNWDRYNKTALKGLVGDKVTVSNKNIDAQMAELVRYYISIVVYRLFSETEFNALVASVYGDLREMNSQFENHQQDYKQTQAYKVYSKISNNYVDALNLMSVEDLKNLNILLKANDIYIPMRQNTVSQFKNGFIQKTRFLLSKLIKEIGRVASLWYEDSYNEKIHNKNHPYEPRYDEPLDKRYF